MISQLVVINGMQMNDVIAVVIMQMNDVIAVVIMQINDVIAVVIMQMNDVIASCESDKLALQQHQTSGMQQLLEETEQRLRKVEEEHKEQAMAMVSAAVLIHCSHHLFVTCLHSDRFTSV